MKKTQEQQYTFEEFDEHISLWNMIPAGDGSSLVLLRKILDGSQSGSFSRAPSLLIVGEGADTFAMAIGNSLCSSDIRQIEGKYLSGTKDQMSFFGDSLFDTVHIVSDPRTMSMNESVLWHMLRERRYKFSSFDGKNFEYIHVNGLLVLVAKNIKLLSPQIIKAVDFKVIIDEYTQEQLELIVHQRLRFCGIDYGEDGRVLKAVVQNGNKHLNLIIDLLKICILMVRAEHQEKLTLKLIERASKLI